jgi:hypothetical protein
MIFKKMNFICLLTHVRWKQKQRRINREMDEERMKTEKREERNE